MNITEKLLEARKRIKETPIAKQGKNEFSKYDYFTPSQVSELVNTVCQELKILPVFSLIKDQFGLFGVLRLIDLEEPESHIATEMRTEMPKITATNMTQQMGGCETYTKRYMLMSAFDITDNNLDFDSQDNRTKEPVTEGSQLSQEVLEQIESCKTTEELERFYMAFTDQEKRDYNLVVTRKKKELL